MSDVSNEYVGVGSQRLNVLVVDDEAQIREVIEDGLTLVGMCNVSTADDGVSGLRKIDEVEPDVLLLDMLMPVSDGFSVLQSMQSGACHHRPTRVIAMSGLTDSDTVTEIMKLGADSVLAKPFTLRELRAACIGVPQPAVG